MQNLECNAEPAKALNKLIDCAAPARATGPEITRKQNYCMAADQTESTRTCLNDGHAEPVIDKQSLKHF